LEIEGDLIIQRCER